MADPGVVSDAFGEWVELHNPAADPIDLGPTPTTAWYIRDDGTNNHQIATSLVIPPGGYVVLCRNVDSGLNGGVTCDYEYSNPSIVLTNGGDEIVLVFEEDGQPDVEVDRITYTGIAPLGHSVSLRHPYLTNSPLVIPANPELTASWDGMDFGISTTAYHTANDGTPGAKNADVWSEQNVIECDDTNICTWDLCEAGECDNPWIAGCCLSDADCNDQDDCTIDSCDVPNNQCDFDPIDNCCEDNSDCVDDNPCNYDYCHFTQCRHSAFNVVPGCCYAPSDINPDTGLPWDNPQQKQAYADDQCDDKNPCTDPDYCDMDNNICQSGPPVQDCCTNNADCAPDPPDPCYFYKCINTVCYVNKKSPECCVMPSDPAYDPAVHGDQCDDGDNCTTDECNLGICRNFLDPTTCCPDDQWCEVYVNDNNDCTEEKCVWDPALGVKVCEHWYIGICAQDLPYLEPYDGNSTFQEVGWEIYDYGSNSLAHWIMESGSGGLGPDEHVLFQWNPTTTLVKSVAVTPLLDASTSGIDAFNTQQATTVQWRMSYFHSVPGEPVSIKVIASADGNYQGGEILWQGILTDDLEYDLYSAVVPDSIKFAETLQIGFMIETPTTFSMDAWEFDDIVVAAGVSNGMVKAMIYQCMDASCNIFTNAVKVAESATEIPDLTMVVDEHYRYVLCYEDLDASTTLWTYWGRPHAFLDGTPMDEPSFFVPVDMEGFGNSCKGGSPAVVNAVCGAASGADFFCMLDIDPQDLDTNQGIYRVGIIGQDEWNADPDKPRHSPFQSLNKTTVSILLAEGYLVWSPLSLLDPSATVIKTALLDAGKKAQIITKLDLISDLGQYDGIFGTLGVYGRSHEMTSSEANALKVYLDDGIDAEGKGGRLYLETGEFWKTGVSQGETVLHTDNYFKIEGESDGASKLDGPLDGRHFLWGNNYNYSQNWSFNSWNDRLAHTDGEGGREIQHNAGAVDFATAVSFEYCGPSSTCWDLNGNGICELTPPDNEDIDGDNDCDYEDCNCGNMYRTIGSSILFGGLIDKGTGTLDDIMGEFLDFFENGYPPCTVDDECFDFEVCTVDTCDGGSCVNMPIQDCVPCKNDEIQEDGSPSCGPDQACWVEMGRCVNIECDDGLGGMGTCMQTIFADGDQIPKNFGNHPQVVDVTATSTHPGWIRDLQVKVKVSHFYRGDVKLSLMGPDGTTIELKKSNLSDPERNIYETYDIGVPITCESPPCDELVTFDGKVLAGPWKLIAEDTNPLIFSGAVDDWKLYASYEAPECVIDDDCDDTNECTLDQCIGYFCEWTNTDCTDYVHKCRTEGTCDPVCGPGEVCVGDECFEEGTCSPTCDPVQVCAKEENDCTIDSCDSDTGECNHEPQPGAGCGCVEHADCPGDEVCLNDSDGGVCDDWPCTCHYICDIDIYGADCGTYELQSGVPAAIPDGVGSVTRIRTIAGVDGVVRQLWVKVVTDHEATGDLSADLCNGTTCVKLHHLSGGNQDGFYKVFDYDPISGPGALSDFNTIPVDGDWTLEISDAMTGDTGTLDEYTVFILKTDCYVDDDCNDQNPCTIDECTVIGDVGTCANNTIQCEPTDDPCTTNQCNPATGLCEEGNEQDGITCDDGLYCTTDDYCSSGVCTGGPGQDCTYLDGNCLKGWCDEDAGSCIPISLKDGVDPGLGGDYDCATSPCACDAGEPCITGDYCNADGNCVQGDTYICPCTDDTDCDDDNNKCNGILGCNETSGFCELDEPEKDCDGIYEAQTCTGDGDCMKLCVEDADCSSGSCVDYLCAGGDPADQYGYCGGDGYCHVPECKNFLCIPITGVCFEQDTMNFFPCDDGLFCTITDYCETGVCISDTARDCSGMDEECKDGVCDDLVDLCVGQNKADATECELDGLGCTIDWCQTGACVKNINCIGETYCDNGNVDCTGEVGDICNDGLCQNLGWGDYDCIQDPLPDGHACDDDTDPCTNDICQAAACEHIQVENCTGPCGYGHPLDSDPGHIFDAGDHMCGYEDSCVGGIDGYPNGTCTPTCNAPNCDGNESGIVDLPIDEKNPCTTTFLTVASAFTYVESVEIKAEVVHSYLADLTVEVIDPQGYEHIMWNNIGGSNEDFANTFDLSLPVPYTGIPNSGLPMCSLTGETASGDWYLRVCDWGNGNGGYIHEWKVYVRGSDDPLLNEGHRCGDAIDLGNLDIVPATEFSGSTECSVNSMSSNCGGANGPDRVYMFEITEAKRMTLVLEQGFGNDMIAFIKEQSGGTCAPGSLYCANLYPADQGDEVIDVQLIPGTYYLGVDTNGGMFDYGPYQFDLRLKTLLPDGSDCDLTGDPGDEGIGPQNLDCESGYCGNGYCCDIGDPNDPNDCCPGGTWPTWADGVDPDAIKTDGDWISAQAVCPAEYYNNDTDFSVCDPDPEPDQGDLLNFCQGHGFDANCVNSICEKIQVHDDTSCDNSVVSSMCGLFVSTVCGDYGPPPLTPPGAQDTPPCMLVCSSNTDCDPIAHCDPVGQDGTVDPVPDPTAPPWTNVCLMDLIDGKKCNEDSDCVSDHCQNGYCCDHDDCCPTNDPDGALECPASYTTAPTCTSSAECEGQRKDPICSSFICGDVSVEDDCDCSGEIADNCGLFIAVFCPAAPDPPDPDAPPGACSQEPYPVTGGGQNVWQATDPVCLTSCLDTGTACTVIDDLACGSGGCNTTTGLCEDDSLCDDIANCDPDPTDANDSICIADSPYGYPCNEDSDCKNFSSDTLPGHCQNGYCCLAGDCCAIDLGCGPRCESATTDSCVPACGAGDVCANGECKKESSSCSPGCGAEEVCVDPFANRCETEGTCNPACDSGEVCAGGLCKAEGTDCDPSCGAGDVCVDLYPNGCSMPSVCPGTYSAPSTCDDQTECRGHRVGAFCDVNFTCGSQDVDSDTACLASMVSDECGWYISVYCNGDMVQIDPPCPTSCDENVECDLNAHCDPPPPDGCTLACPVDESPCSYEACPYDSDNHPPAGDDPPGSGTMECQPDLPNDGPPPGGPPDGWACSEGSDCASGYCQMHFCCDDGGCCKGCEVTGWVPSFGGGGTDEQHSFCQSDADAGGDCFPNGYVQTTWGQVSPSGRSIGTGNMADFGALPNSTEQFDGPSCSPAPGLPGGDDCP